MKEVLFVVGLLTVSSVIQSAFGWFLAAGKRHMLPEGWHIAAGAVNVGFVLYILISEYAGKIAAFVSSSPGESSFWGYLAIAFICAIFGGVVSQFLAGWSFHLAQKKRRYSAKASKAIK